MHKIKLNNAMRYAILLILVALCWLPQFNLYISEFIDQALLQSSLVYASARGVNAAISLLQSAEIGIGIASIEPAQLLDPINDLAEYIASVMRFAIGSLFIQRILYSISSGLLFSIVFSLGALGYITCHYFGYFKAVNSKLLISLIVIRFVVPATILFTGFASQVFLDDDIDNQNKDIESKVAVIQANANSASTLSSKVKAQINSQKQTLVDEIELVNVQALQLHTQVQQNKDRISQLKLSIEKVQAKRSLQQKLTLTELEQAKPLINEQQKLQTTQAHLNNRLAKLSSDKATLMHRLEEINNQLNGNDESNISRIVDAVTSGINNMVSSAENLFMDFLNLVALLALKLLLIPLLFLYLFKKIFTVIWQTPTLTKHHA